MMLYLFLAHISHQIVPYLSSTGFWKLAATTARYSGQAVGVETGIDRGLSLRRLGKRAQGMKHSQDFYKINNVFFLCNYCKLL
ncbi:hypothetical protein HanXRQr2_Chr15g0711321 [Helianthus annuus]|uniref:Uncharacterized protein n=1 Tax=Helianthus annuus TaxID=4232 RepID=A0A9K3E388_HELAN|nr:hypothetical protein HanXRQr2_Chr15g0711321 [Helianthus annuus]KAJ0457463.1 hypothetical protein HanIR_Chr15g0774011 [Helianthus annuus]KAJ0832789.1 hypothetical protein HanPSC8_Chr15g0682701 [Helianthus annuus]